MRLGTDDVVGPRIEVTAAVKHLNTDVVLLDAIDVAVHRLVGNIAKKSAEFRGSAERAGTENPLDFGLR
jgi:hypothetical protein